jgi:hypothetical protein
MRSIFVRSIFIRQNSLEAGWCNCATAKALSSASVSISNMGSHVQRSVVRGARTSHRNGDTCVRAGGPTARDWCYLSHDNSDLRVMSYNILSEGTLLELCMRV